MRLTIKDDNKCNVFSPFIGESHVEFCTVGGVNNTAALI